MTDNNQEETYKAAVVHKYTGNPEDFTIAELPRPQLTADTQVEIKVHAASLNPIDYKRAEGLLSIPLPEPFPLKLGYDVAGVVAKTGDRVTRFKPGDRVYGRVASEDVGTIAEYSIADQSCLAPIPANISFTTAASVPLAGLTAKQSLDKLELQSDHSFFVTSGLGGVGMFAILLAKHHYNAKEIVTTVSTRKVELAKQLGATRVLDYTAKEEDYIHILEDSADRLFDTIGESSLYIISKPDTKAASVAMVSDGSALDDFKQDKVPLSTFGNIKLALVKKLVSGAGWYFTRGYRSKGVEFSYVKMKPDGADLEKTFNPLLESETIKPVISNVYPFTDEGVAKAFEESRGGHATGKIIVKVQD
ncbi:hypothetical protein GGI12_003326 [Dipsacomyces acuminosporus]|nr:hypothetical protein GGI12_003326 [Dipsacomyces acuminosporus]